MTHADLMSLPILLAAVPVGTVLGSSHSLLGVKFLVVLYEACLRIALVGIALIGATLAQGIEGAAEASIFAAIPVGLLLVEIGWALSAPLAARPDD